MKTNIENIQGFNQLPNSIGVYAIENNITGRKYIGSSKNIKKRITNHYRQLNNGTHPNHKLQKDWNELINTSFTFRTVKECEINNLISVEQKVINHYNAVNSGYNIHPIAGGDLTYFINNPEILKSFRKNKTPKNKKNSKTKAQELKLEKIVNQYKKDLIVEIQQKQQNEIEKQNKQEQQKILFETWYIKNMGRYWTKKTKRKKTSTKLKNKE